MRTHGTRRSITLTSCAGWLPGRVGKDLRGDCRDPTPPSWPRWRFGSNRRAVRGTSRCLRPDAGPPQEEAHHLGGGPATDRRSPEEALGRPEEGEIAPSTPPRRRTTGSGDARPLASHASCVRPPEYDIHNG